MYIIEWQKRGLPHAHFVTWSTEKIRAADKVISVELPDSQSDPELYKMTSTHMIHGPWGAPERTLAMYGAK